MATLKNLCAKLSTSAVRNTFATEVAGYHMICDAAIKEAVWEEINRNVASVACTVAEEANGGHKSGADMTFDDVGISMKSAKIDNAGGVSISSYRLTTVCSDKNPGSPAEIVANIAARDASYEHYSILAREETHGGRKVHYYWCLVPKTVTVFKADAAEFRPKMGKMGKNKGAQVGWETDALSISFSMSSQLWFAFKFADIKEYVVADTVVEKSAVKITYSDIHRMVKPYQERLEAVAAAASVEAEAKTVKAVVNPRGIEEEAMRVQSSKKKLRVVERPRSDIPDSVSFEADAKTAVPEPKAQP